VPEAELIKFRKEIADQLVETALLAKEAMHRGLHPDQAKVDEQIQAYADQYSHLPEWEQNKDKALRIIRKDAENEDLVIQLDALIRDIEPPGKAAVQAFYESNKDKFTTPAQDHIWVILLKVAPFAESETWDGTRELAERLVAEIREGGDFAELAKQYSDDPSASQGGNLGFLHRGMLSDESLEAIEQKQLGEVTEPVLLLEGYGIFKRTEHVEPSLRSLNDVEDRARRLLVREMQGLKWSSFIENLRSKATVVLYESHYIPSDL
jgi:peptidyl-prolyl cis-trans isomerase C